MYIEHWLLPTLFSLVLWGVAMFLPKLAVRRLSPYSVVVYHTFFTFFGACLALFVSGVVLEFEMTGVLIAVSLGMIGSVAQLLYLMAIKHGSLTNVTIVTSLYPVIAAVLAYVFLQETLTVQQVAGIVLGVMSIVLMVVAGDKQTS